MQLVKERKEQQEKERIGMIEAKIQQKEQQTKEKKVSRDHKPPVAAAVTKVSAVNNNSGSVPKKLSVEPSKKTSVAAKSALASPGPLKATRATPAQEAAPKKNSVFAKPPAPVVAVKSSAKTAKPLGLKNVQMLPDRKPSPAMTMQNKAKDGLRQGELAKQAMFQSMLAAGDSDAHCINSTFLVSV